MFLFPLRLLKCYLGIYITRAQEDQALLDVFGPSSSSPGNKQSILIIKIIIIIIHPQVLGTNKQIILRESET